MLNTSGQSGTGGKSFQMLQPLLDVSEGETKGMRKLFHTALLFFSADVSWLEH